MRKSKPMNVDLLELIYSYDPLTGLVTKKGKPVGKVSRDGYVRVGNCNHRILVQRLAWCLYYRKDPGDACVFHKNGDKADNRIENLGLKRRAKAKQPPCTDRWLSIKTIIISIPLQMLMRMSAL